MLIIALSHLYSMGRKLLIFLVCQFTLCMISDAQVKKVYAYKQASIPGNIIGPRENENEKRNAIKQREQKQSFNYWFYLSIPKKDKVNITGLWIDGKQHEIKSETITDLPVKKIVYTGLEKNDTTIMVPVTSNKVILVHPAGIKSAGIKLKRATTNELVIRYTWKGKIYYATTRKIKELTPDVRV
ncbi:MAG TPA: hypothetical protein VFP97_07065 [Chitinophagaceae bacterium]|nr:hypothetical protein [Chitinophagaceae bacterium]